jgi:hypothetical protein
VPFQERKHFYREENEGWKYNNQRPYFQENHSRNNQGLTSKGYYLSRDDNYQRDKKVDFQE